jgi:hypothetical protein
LPPKITPIRPTAKGEETVGQKAERYFSKLLFDNADRPLTEPKWLVRNTVSDGGIVFIGGQSGAGKSYIALELAVSIMTGEDFFGRKVERRGAVVRLAAEGQSTIDARLAAVKLHHGIVDDLPFAYLGELPSLETNDEREVRYGCRPSNSCNRSR